MQIKRNHMHRHFGNIPSYPAIRNTKYTKTKQYKFENIKISQPFLIKIPTFNCPPPYLQHIANFQVLLQQHQ